MTRLDVLAQGSNFEEWGDVLVIAIMAILWLIGGLAKVITSKKGAGQQRPQEGPAKPQRRRESWQERLARKAEEMQRAAEARGRQTQQETGARTAPSPPAGKITVRKGPKGESVLVYERPPSPPSTEREQQAARERETRKAILAAGRQAAKSPAVEPRSEVQGPGSEPIVESMAAVMREPPRSLVPETARSEAAREPAGGYHPAAIIDYSDPDALRKAVLHYEILGRPLALREPADETGSF